LEWNRYLAQGPSPTPVSRAAARGGRAPMAGLGVVLAVLVSIMVYLGWQHGLTLGQIPSILAQTPLWFYVAIAAIVLFAMAVGLRGDRAREAPAPTPAPKPRPAAASRARTARPAEEPPAQPRVVVEFVPVGPTIVAEPTEAPLGLPAPPPSPGSSRSRSWTSGPSSAPRLPR